MKPTILLPIANCRLAIAALLLAALPLHAAEKITDLPAATSVASTDLALVVINPGSTPVTKKITIGNLELSIDTLGTITTGTWNASVIAGAYGGTGVANTGKTITLGGNFTTSGAYAATFTLTGATGITLPTTGTLATLAGAEAFSNKTYNGNTFTAGTGTLTLGAGKTLTASNTLTLTGTDGSTAAFGAGGTIAYVDIATNAQSGTTYTLALTDDGARVAISNASANTVTIPTNASVAFPVGAQVVVSQGGAGTTTIAAAGGVTLHNLTGVNTLAGQYAYVTLIKTATNTWDAIGGFGPLALTGTGLTVTNTGTQIDFGYDALHRGTFAMVSDGGTALTIPGSFVISAGGGNALALGNNYLQVQGSNGSVITQSTVTTDNMANVCVYNDGGGQFGGGTGIGPGGATHRVAIITNGSKPMYWDPARAVVNAVPLRILPVHVAALAASPLAGDMAAVDDANTPVTGSTVAGSGAAFALVCWNGSNWIVVSH